MSTPYDIRKKRIQNDIQELEKVECDAIECTILGNSPFKIHVVYNIRSIVGISSTGTPSYRDKHEVEINVPSGYPFSGNPEATMKQGYSPLYHPNFWSSGSICTQATSWTANETLALFIIRLAKMFQFDPAITNPDSPANSSAANWYSKNLGNGLFPTDRQVLPLLDDEQDDFRLEDTGSDFEIRW
jgi:ubiquitin-protein ligase